MRVVEVIPIIKGITKPTLSYFTKEHFSPGQFVKIPVKSGTTLGVVARSTEAQKAKASLKDAPFALRKLTKVEATNGISESFMSGVKKTAYFYGTTAGSALSALIPKKFLEDPKLFGTPGKRKSNTVKETKVVQLTHNERFREYRSIVRENFARGKSVLFIVPTNDEVDKAVALLSLGIEQYVFATKDIQKAQTNKHPVLLVTTPLYAIFDRPDLDTVIVERENSRAYRSLSRPFINVKKFLEYYSKERGLTLILGDSVLSLEALYKEREGEYAELSPLSWRQKYSSSAEIIDMRERKEFDIFSEKMKTSIEKTLQENKKVFLFALRKGSAPTTVCDDCGSVLLCKNCRSPMVLHDGPIYVCHHCGARRSPETRCDTCGSWKLTALGIGIDRVAEEARAHFPDAEIIVIDKDRVKTAAQAKRLIKQFNASEKSILIGTELALHYFERVSLVVVVTLDSLFSIPDFGINERIFYLVTKLRESASETLLIQSRNAGDEMLRFAATGNVLDFYRTEIKEREDIIYPPFSLFIRVTTSGNRDRVEKKAAYLQSLFNQFHPHFALGHELVMTIRVSRAEWPHDEIIEKLLLLSPEFLIKVDPESIL